MLKSCFLERNHSKPLLDSTKTLLYIVIENLQINSTDKNGHSVIDGLKFLQLVQAVAAEQK